MSTLRSRLVPPARIGTLLSGAVLLGALGWSYAPALAGLVVRWWREPDYLHGFLVPVFAAFLLWNRRGLLRDARPSGQGWGLLLLAVAAALRWASAYYYYALLDPLSLIPCLAGLTLFVGGWRALRWAWPSLVFLVFMVPLPGFVAGILSHPLQRIGTIVSTYLLQTMGIPAVAQGNVIILTDMQLGVVEACNGLRMMVLFLAVCTGGALLVDRPWLEKVLIVLSAAPIAVVANVFRITLTGILHETVSHDLADAVFHDFAGWLMMPSAVILLWVEMAMLSRLLLPPRPAGPVGLSATLGEPPRSRPKAAAGQTQRKRR